MEATRSTARVLALAIVSTGCSSSPTTALGMTADASIAVDARAPADAALTIDAGAPIVAGGSADAGSSSADAGPSADAGTSSQLAFVATYLGGLLVFAVDPDSGALVEAPGSPYDPRGTLYAQSLDPTGQFLYAVDINANTIIGFRTTPASAALTPLPHFPVITGSGPVAIAIDPMARFVYVATSGPDASLFVYTRNRTDGTLVRSAGSPHRLGSEANSVAPDPSGRFVYLQSVSGIHAYAVDGVSGDLTEIDHSPFTATLGGALAFHPGGTLLFNGGRGLNVLAVDADSGALRPVEGSPFTSDVGSDPTATVIALDPKGKFVYAVDTFTGHLSGFAIDVDTVKLTPVPDSPFDAKPSPYSVAVDPTGRFVYVGNDDADEISAFAINPANGSLTPVPHSPFPAIGLQPEITFSKPVAPGN